MRLARPIHPDDAHFDITAMVDIVMLLVIFFALTVRFTELRSMPLDLPRQAGSPADPQEKPGLFVVDVTADGRYRVLGVEESLQWVAQRLARDVRTAGGPDGLDVVIRAESGCPARHVNALALIMTQAGVRRWKLATDSEGGAGS